MHDSTAIRANDDTPSHIRVFKLADAPLWVKDWPACSREGEWLLVVSEDWVVAKLDEYFKTEHIIMQKAHHPNGAVLYVTKDSNFQIAKLALSGVGEFRAAN